MSRLSFCLHFLDHLHFLRYYLHFLDHLQFWGCLHIEIVFGVKILTFLLLTAVETSTLHYKLLFILQALTAQKRPNSIENNFTQSGGRESELKFLTVLSLWSITWGMLSVIIVGYYLLPVWVDTNPEDDVVHNEEGKDSLHREMSKDWTGDTTVGDVNKH